MKENKSKNSEHVIPEYFKSTDEKYIEMGKRKENIYIIESLGGIQELNRLQLLTLEEKETEKKKIWEEILARINNKSLKKKRFDVTDLCLDIKLNYLKGEESFVGDIDKIVELGEEWFEEEKKKVEEYFKDR